MFPKSHRNQAGSPSQSSRHPRRSRWRLPARTDAFDSRSLFSHPSKHRFLRSSGTSPPAILSNMASISCSLSRSSLSKALLSFSAASLRSRRITSRSASGCAPSILKWARSSLDDSIMHYHDPIHLRHDAPFLDKLLLVFEFLFGTCPYSYIPLVISIYLCMS